MYNFCIVEPETQHNFFQSLFPLLLWQDFEQDYSTITKQQITLNSRFNNVILLPLPQLFDLLLKKYICEIAKRPKYLQLLIV